MKGEKCETLIDDIKSGSVPKVQTPVRMLNALYSLPLRYRTFGGNYQYCSNLTYQALEIAFGGHYLVTQLAQCAIIKQILYNDGSRNTFYCDKNIFDFFNSHGLFNLGFWDDVDYETIENNITPQNTDARIYYSACKPDAILSEARKAAEVGEPVLFIDSDLILKRRHDCILPNADKIKAAYGHIEALSDDYYPDFEGLHFPQGYKLPDSLNTTLPAVNTCLMFFNDFRLLEEWCGFFKELFINNFIDGSINSTTISQQLLGIDQRTFPMIADKHGCWDTKDVVPFLNIIWNPPGFYFPDGTPAEWHYYTLEQKPEQKNWLQDITHIWISKKDIERDTHYRNYQSCLMLELILALMPQAETALRSFNSLKPYFDLLLEYGDVDTMLNKGIVSEHLTKNLLL